MIQRALSYSIWSATAYQERLYHLARSYEHAEGVPRDYDRALNLYCQAAQEGSSKAAFNIGWMLGGVVLVEQVFSYPGLGSLVLFAIEQRDTPLLQASMFFVAVGYCVANLLADVAYALLDPRIRYS